MKWYEKFLISFMVSCVVFLLIAQSPSIKPIYTKLNDIFDVNVPSPTDTYVLTWDDTTAKWISAAAATTGAPVGASYLTLGLHATLTAERVLTAGTGIGFTDIGANGTLTIASNDGAIDHNNLSNYVAGQHIDMADVYHISATGGDYATIQAALTAQTTGGELFLVGPGTYTDDTINFTANDQCVRGLGLTPQNHVTTANARIVNFGAYTGCRIENMKMTVTAATTAIDTITGTGSLFLRWCHVGMTADAATGVQTADQPSCIDTTGAVTMTKGTIEYTNNRTDGGGATAIKAAIRTDEDSDVTFSRTTFTIAGAGQSLATTPFYGQSGIGENPEFEAYRIKVTVVDNATSNAIGFAYINLTADTVEMHGCDCHVTNTGANAFGAWLIGTGTLRSEFCHIHVVGVVARSFNVGAGTTVNSQFDDIIAANGTTGAGTINMVSSEADGDFRHTGFLSTNYYNNGNSGASITIDWNNGNLQYVTLTGVGVDITFTEPPHPGRCELWIIQDGTGSRTIDWEHEISPKWPGDVEPTLSTGVAAVDLIAFRFIGGTTYRGLFNGDFR